MSIPSSLNYRSSTVCTLSDLHLLFLWFIFFFKMKIAMCLWVVCLFVSNTENLCFCLSQLTKNFNSLFYDINIKEVHYQHLFFFFLQIFNNSGVKRKDHKKWTIFPPKTLNDLFNCLHYFIFRHFYKHKKN